MAKTPTSVKFDEATRQRMEAYLKATEQFSAAALINFAVKELFVALDAGGRIQSEGEGGFRLVRADDQIDRRVKASAERAAKRAASKRAQNE